MLDWLLGLLLPDGPGFDFDWGSFALCVVQLLIFLILIGRARRYRLEAERYAMRAEEASRIATTRRDREHP